MAQETLTAKERFITVMDGGIPDRLPVTTHHVMSYFLNTYMNGISNEEFFDHFGLDPIHWLVAHKPSDPDREYPDPDQGEPGFLEAKRVSSDDWRIRAVPLDGYDYTTTRYDFITPKKTLSMVLQSNDQTAWVAEHLIKEKSDIDVIGEYMTQPVCDIEAVNSEADAYGDRGMLRGHLPCFDVFGQPGCWQDFSCLYGTEKLIMATFDDPAWVHSFLNILLKRKLAFARSLAGARYDLLEFGGGDASTTVISPTLFAEFVAPYDSQVIAAAHEAGQRIVYHTCGGMMPILEAIADMGPDGMETFTPRDMGGDVDLKEAKKRIGDRVFMIGGFDQFHYLSGCTPEKTRAAVHQCFTDAGEGGGYILCPSDHFFDADVRLLEAFADEAINCRY